MTLIQLRKPYRGRQKPLRGNPTRRRAHDRQLLELEAARKKDRQREKSRKVTNELMLNVGV
jgi:hypothetical protein